MELESFSGKEIRGYRIGERIGQGGMAAVYKAEHIALHTLRAVKVIRNEAMGNPVFISRFTREARVLVHLKHPNLVRVHDFFKEGEHLFIVMEYVSGHSLMQEIKKRGMLPARELLPLVIQSLDGLAEAHSKGIIHRDISPENLMISSDSKGAPRLVIIDFGIAKAIEDGEVSASLKMDLTATGKFMGKLHYCSPEQVSGMALDYRSDLYSLGLVMYRALTGKMAFHGNTPVDTLSMRCLIPAPKLSEAHPDLNFPRELELIVAKMLAIKPEDRYQDAFELKWTLENYLHRTDRFSEPSEISEEETRDTACITDMETKSTSLPESNEPAPRNLPAMPNGTRRVRIQPEPHHSEPQNNRKPVSGIPRWLLILAALAGIFALIGMGFYLGTQFSSRLNAPVESSK